MSVRRYPPLAKKVKQGKWQPNHAFVIAGPNAWGQAESLFNSGHCQPAIAYPGDKPANAYRWPVYGMEVTIKNLGTSESDTEQLVFELLKAGAILVVNAEHATGEVSVYRREGLQNAAWPDAC